MKFEIKNSLDWPVLQEHLHKLGKMLPEFSKDMDKIIKHLQEEVSQLSKLEVEHRRTKSSGSANNCIRQAEKINLELKKMEQYHLMAVLSK